MSWEPITYCRVCDEPFDVYAAPDERVCDGCKELLCADCPSHVECIISPRCVGVGGFAPGLVARALGRE